MIFGSRFKEIRLSLSLNQREFAEKLGITQGNLSKIEGDKQEPSFQILDKIFVLGINLHWLLTGEGSMFFEKIPVESEPNVETPNLETVLNQVKKQEKQFEALSARIAKLESKQKHDADLPDSCSETTPEYGGTVIPVLGAAAAGVPISAAIESHAAERIRLKCDADIKSGRDYYALEVQGDSMTDEGIFNGSLALVEAVDCLENGQIGVFNLDGAATVKKYHLHSGGQVTLDYCNGTGAKIVVNREQCIIQGRVVCVLEKSDWV